MKKRYKFAVCLIILIAMLGSYRLGYIAGQPEKTNRLLVGINSRPIIKKAPVPMGKLSDFSSYEALVAWLKTDTTDEFLAERGDSIFCAETVEAIIHSAENSGYRLHFEVLTKTEYEKFYLGTDAVVSVPYNAQGWRGPWPELPEGSGHSVATAIIGNCLYCIEPRTDDVWLYGDLVR